jgi:UDP-N-acetylmuramate--alanine ligase
MLGIGGIGMSALARYLQQKGHPVSGYDRTPTELTDALIKQGIPVFFDEDEQRAARATFVIYTPAVKDSIELKTIRQKNIPVLKRAEMLGAIASSHRLIAIAGTHGKTTTTSLTTHLLKSAGVDVGAFVGGIMANYDTNFFMGQSDWWVAEADEFDRSFLTLWPEVTILTSVDADHLDIYGTDAAVKAGYKAFVGQLKPDGLLIYHKSLEVFVAETGVLNKVSYAIDGDADIIAGNLQYTGLQARFSYTSKKLTINDLALNVTGKHNVENALAAITAAAYTGARPEAVKQALASFKGVKRRFELHVNKPEVVYIDDYAHHPAELTAVLTAARQVFPDRYLIVAFQPHLYTRTRDFYQEFAQALSLADEVFLTPIYPARELSIPHVTSDLIFQHLSTTYKHLISLAELPQSVAKSVSERIALGVGKPSVVISAGAGDIDTIVLKLKDALTRIP